eukprot:scaffold573_cov19-Tisochrysis_lutea.AAC.1
MKERNQHPGDDPGCSDLVLGDGDGDDAAVGAPAGDCEGVAKGVALAAAAAAPDLCLQLRDFCSAAHGDSVGVGGAWGTDGGQKYGVGKDGGECAAAPPDGPLPLCHHLLHSTHCAVLHSLHSAMGQRHQRSAAFCCWHTAAPLFQSDTVQSRRYCQHCCWRHACIDLQTS